MSLGWAGLSRRGCSALRRYRSLSLAPTACAAYVSVTPVPRQRRGGLSLGELASAFSELGKASAASPTSSSSSKRDNHRTDSVGDDGQSGAREEAKARAGRAPVRDSHARAAAHRSHPFASSASTPQPQHSHPHQHQQQQQHNTRTRVPFVTGAMSAATASPRSAPSSSRTTLVTFTAAYSQQLSALSTARLTAEVDEQHRRQHFGNIVSCLVEVHMRLLSLSRERHVQEDAHSRERPRFADMLTNDELLLAVLSCLTKIDLTEVETEVDAWVAQLAKLPAESGARFSAPSQGDVVTPVRDAAAGPFLSLFCSELQRWLLARASELGVGHSIACLHLIAQQKLFFHDAIVATLAENVACRRPVRDLEEFAVSLPFTPCESIAQCNAEKVTVERCVLPLDACAVLMEMLARSQASVRTVLRIADRQVPPQTSTSARDRVLGGASSDMNGDDTSTHHHQHQQRTSLSPPREASVEVATHASRRTTLADRQDKAHALATVLDTHPIFNERFFTVCAEALIESLTYAATLSLSVVPGQARLAAHDETDENRTRTAAAAVDAADGSGREEAVSVVHWIGHNVTRFSQLPPASFFFLTRALAKLNFFHAGVIPALLPHLTPYLQQHPEQYLGPVLLLGRSENTSITVEAATVLLQNVNNVLSRRGDVYTRELRTQRDAQQQQQQPRPHSRTVQSEEESTPMTMMMMADTEDNFLLLSGGRHKEDDFDDVLLMSHGDADDLGEGEAHSAGLDTFATPQDDVLDEGGIGEKNTENGKSTPGGSTRLKPAHSEALLYRAHHGKMLLSKQIARAQAHIALAAQRADDDYRQHPQRVSVIALHASPLFLTSVTHVYRLAWAQAVLCESQDTSQGWTDRAVLLKEMLRLYHQLLNDFDHGLPRQLEVISQSLPPAAIENLLHRLLEVRELLQHHLSEFDTYTHNRNKLVGNAVKVGTPSRVSRPDTSSSSASASTVPVPVLAPDEPLRAALNTPHALLVILTFLWTQQLRRRPIMPTQGEVSTTWCRPACELTQSLLAAGLLSRREVRPPLSAHTRRGEDRVRYHSRRTSSSSAAFGEQADDDREHSGDAGEREAEHGSAHSAPPSSSSSSFCLHFIPETILSEAPRVEELVHRAKLAKLLKLREREAANSGGGRHGSGDSPHDVVVREVRNSSVFFPFSRRIEFAEQSTAS